MKSAAGLFLGVFFTAVVREGSKITLMVNGVRVWVANNSLNGGLTNVGVVAIPYSDSPDSFAHFDNFSIEVITPTPQTNTSSGEGMGVGPAANSAFMKHEEPVGPIVPWPRFKPLPEN